VTYEMLFLQFYDHMPCYDAVVFCGGIWSANNEADSANIERPRKPSQTDALEV